MGFKPRLPDYFMTILITINNKMNSKQMDAFNFKDCFKGSAHCVLLADGDTSWSFIQEIKQSKYWSILESDKTMQFTDHFRILTSSYSSIFYGFADGSVIFELSFFRALAYLAKEIMPKTCMIVVSSHHHADPILLPYFVLGNPKFFSIR